MDYQLENLGDERFQEVCQALIAKEFPKSQCFPVGQPDGGRDATAFFMNSPHSGYIVFQVKYVRNVLASRDPHKWLAETVADELPKIKALIPQGAKEYFLITNIPGTAHLESGSIDTTQALFSTTLPFPAQCWWRNDVNRRLDNAWDVKWCYPELLSGPDFLRLILESGLTEDSERRTNAINAFIRAQFDQDEEVRFKQIELQNKLLELFIDVPATLRDRPNSRSWSNKEYAAYLNTMTDLLPSTERSSPPWEKGVGAASLFLHPLMQTYLPRIVLEGAPGQGKSTLVQYICQIHRRRLLRESMDLETIPMSHRDRPIRIPFKIDLRDFELWLQKKNPFAGETSDAVPKFWIKSLEGFLAAQVSHESGGFDFSVADFAALAKISAILLVFDGLDEVADIKVRKDVVDHINKGVARISENAASVQAIVTSRPAAFANSPGLSPDTFRYFELQSITRPLIDDYASKWLRAKKLKGREASDVKRILRDKLNQPHLKELTRNPMQLSIVLSLIHRFGDSLPEKRTALYQSYIELFLSREAEKSELVRDNRELIIDIHGFLAWRLHADSQLTSLGGRIGSEALETLLTSYLKDELHETSIIKQLFHGVQRVMVLVSRVEGTYEFEVQPLREYFAALHLYSTARYSPQGADYSGTKPDRFNALVRDFYWLNVTRFYAGFYDKGELPSLVDGLEELSQEDGYRHTSHPQSLAAMLLSDWVFAKDRRSMQRVIRLVIDGIGIRHLMASGDRAFKREATFALPDKCGNVEVVARCFELLKASPGADFAHLIIEVIRANGTRESSTQLWEACIAERSGYELTTWLNYGLQLGIASHMSLDKLADYVTDVPTLVHTQWLIRSGRSDFFESREDRYNIAVDAVLDSDWQVGQQRGRTSIYQLANAVNTSRYAMCLLNPQPFALSNLIKRGHVGDDISGDDVEWPNFAAASKVRIFTDVAREQTKVSAYEWATQLSPWDRVVETGRTQFGERWVFNRMAAVAAAIRSREPAAERYDDLLDQSVSLCRRVRFARLRATGHRWWKSQFDRVVNEDDLAFVSLVCLCWAGPSTIAKLSKTIGEKLDDLSVKTWGLLESSLA